MKNQIHKHMPNKLELVTITPLGPHHFRSMFDIFNFGA